MKMKNMAKLQKPVLQVLHLFYKILLIFLNIINFECLFHFYVGSGER